MSNNSAVALKVQEASVIYNNGVQSLDQVSFDLKAGSICGLVGVNGSGKSTLFKSIMGLVPLTHGQVSIYGSSTIKQALKSNWVAYVPQSEEVDWNFPVLVEDVVMMGRYGYMGFFRLPGKGDHQKVHEAIERVGLQDFKRRQIGELSGGQKKRVFLARALAQEARIILLDEPFTGVDVQTELAITQVLLELKSQGRTILVSTHNLGSVPNLCDEVILINKKLIAVGPVASTFNQANLAKTFGTALRHVHLEGGSLHDDSDPRRVTILTDDEHPLVFYGQPTEQSIVKGKKDEE